MVQSRHDDSPPQARRRATARSGRSAVRGPVLLPSPPRSPSTPRGGRGLRASSCRSARSPACPARCRSSSRRSIPTASCPPAPRSNLPAAGTRAWGRFSVGVRCDSPVTGTAYLQARVAVVADYLIAARPPARRPGARPCRPRQRRATSPRSRQSPHRPHPGQRPPHLHRGRRRQPLRGDMLRVPHAVRQGQTVSVLGVGAGFPGGERRPCDEQRRPG